jgi:hypothetical protein
MYSYNLNIGVAKLAAYKSLKSRENIMRSILTLLLALLCVAAPVLVFADTTADPTEARTMPEPPLSYQFEQRKYIQGVEFLIRQNLMLKSVQVENPQAVVVLRFAADGKFQTVQIEEGSGDPSFDMAVELALLKSIPKIPPPPIPPNTTGPFSFTARVCITC